MPVTCGRCQNLPNGVKLLVKFSFWDRGLIKPIESNPLLFIKLDSEKIEDLELNFALDSADFGETKTIELKPGGNEIFVNDDNKIEYIHLVADYKLNKQINRQVRTNKKIQKP